MTDQPMPDYDGTGPAPLHLSSRRLRGDVVVVTIRGELDSATAPQATEYLQQATSPSTETLALDLSDVTFLASSGIQMLVTALRTDHGVNGDLHLIAPNPVVLRVLTLVGMEDVLTLHTGTDEFLHALTGPPS